MLYGITFSNPAKKRKDKNPRRNVKSRTLAVYRILCSAANFSRQSPLNRRIRAAFGAVPKNRAPRRYTERLKKDATAASAMDLGQKMKLQPKSNPQ